MSTPEPVTITLRDHDIELQAISHVVSILDHFEYEARERMINYICERFPTVHIAEAS